jgi:hypothetical protein
MTSPLCIIDHSIDMDRAEAEHGCTLLIRVGGNRSEVSTLRVIDEVVRSFDGEAPLMMIMKAAPQDFLLMLSNIRVVNRVFNRGPPSSGRYYLSSSSIELAPSKLPVWHSGPPSTSSSEGCRPKHGTSQWHNRSLMAPTGFVPCTLIQRQSETS